VILLEQISKYHIEEAYPAFHRGLPSTEEVKEVLAFTEELFSKTCDILEIKLSEIQK